MRTLIILSVLQTIGIAALVVHAFREEPSAAPSAPPPAAASSTISSSASTNEQQLRAIIRAELSRLQASQPAPPPVPPARLRDPAADRQRRNEVAQQIEAYQAVGAITDSQMQELQAAIAQLDEASRKQMLSKLVRALNSGDIKGRL